MEANRVVGYFEKVDNSLFVTGWAKYDGSDVPVKVQLAVNNVIVAERLTDHVRPDLISAGVSNGKSGFRLQIPTKAIRRLKNVIHVLVDEQVIDGSPKVINLSRNMDIRIKKIESQELEFVVRGWRGNSIKAQIKIDGVHVGNAKIPAYYSVASSDGVAVRWRLPDEYCDGRTHVYVVEIDHEDAIVQSDAAVLQYPEFVTHIDHAGFSSVSGWVFRTDRNFPVRVNAFHEGKRIGATVADHLRQDVQQALEISLSNTGFRLNFDAPVDADQAEIVLADADTGIEFLCINVANQFETLASVAQEIACATSRYSLASPALAKGVTSASAASVFFEREIMFNRMNGGKVSVILPVYGGAVELAECMDSIFAAKNDTPAEYILVNDCTPDPVIEEYLRALTLQHRPDVKVLNRKSNHGFSASVNLGMVAAGSNDVILLNADTVVNDHWLDKIVAAADASPNIGTVTPFSSNGEICTLPYLCKSIPVEDLALAAQVDRIATMVNSGKLIDIPVAVGFCMFIRRTCLEDVGLFDAEKWGRGYGEEVDFCLKATSHGWRHVLTPDTFMIHRGAVSFGDEKLERIIESAKKIAEAYPFYDAMIQRFLAKDPVAAARRDVNILLISAELPESKILHISHSLRGGTETYIDDLSYLYAEEDYANLVLRFEPHGASTIEIRADMSAFNGFIQERHQERYKASEIQRLKDHIRTIGITHVHLHSPIGVPADFLEWIASNFTFDVTLHDYAWACPSITFTTSTGHYFGDNPDSQAALAEAFSEPFPGLRAYADAANGDISAYRARFHAILQKARVTISGSQDTADRMRSLGFNSPIRVVEHPNTALHKPPALSTAYHSGEIARVALIGSISDIKGFPTLLACATFADKNNMPLKFIVFGRTKNDQAFADLPNVEITGSYEPHEIARLLSRRQPHIAFFPNRWPETYSYTLSIAMEARLWPVVSDIGAPAERVKRDDFGTVYPRSETPEAICNTLLEIAHSRFRLAKSYQPNAPTTLLDYLG